MSTTLDYIEYVCEQISDVGEIRYRKMFGEYMVYVNNKPVITVCDNTCFVKTLDAIAPMMTEAEKGYPYDGATECYILDIDDADFAEGVIRELEKVTPLPKPRKKKSK